MTKNAARLVPVLAVGTLALAGCAPVFGAPFFGGSAGPAVTDDRDIDAVESVDIRTDGDLTVALGGTPSLRIIAPQSTLTRLTSDIVDGVLVLDAKGPGFTFGEVRYELTVPRLSDVTVEGSSDVTADFTGADEVRIVIDGSGDVTGTGVDAEKVSSSISGSGDIELTGRTDAQTLEIDGSGDYAGSDLESRDTRVDISGSGDAEVFATGSLSADISGSGSVRHRGGATVSGDVSGSGAILEGA